jgi:hypothetical protein
MTAMRAVELPGKPAAEAPGRPAAVRSAQSAASRAAARWMQPPTGTAMPPAPAARREPRRGQAASVPLRLTRRGRIVAAVTAALLLAALSLIIARSALATNHPIPARAAQGLTQVIVRPGQSLWSVAANADPHADTRVVIQRIMELNGLTTNVVFAGQRLWVPRG